jgi:hypothetical protein
MPFTSKAQQRYLFAKHPEVAKEFAAKTPNIKKLPEHVHPAAKTAAKSWKKLHGK